MSPALPESETLLALATVLIAIGFVTIILLVRKVVALRDGTSERAASRAMSWQALLDGLPDPTIVTDPEGRMVRANRAWTELHVPGAQPAQPAPVRLVDEAIETADGTRWISWAERQVEVDGARRVLRSGREITDRVQTLRLIEEARRKAETGSEAKSRFLATVSHEFRTPLNGIVGMTRLLLDTDLDPEQTTYVQAVRSSSEAFLSLIEDILDFAKIESGRIDIADETVDLRALVSGVAELLAPRAQGKGTEIACFVARDVPTEVRGDADKLRQVLINLAGNAVKFTARGGAGIAVRRGPDDTVRFCIEDTGPGIPADKAARIFEEFEQVEGAAPTSETGTGLGLAITRRLVERMGGTITLDSEVGIGSRFHVELPLPAVEQPVEAPPSAPVAGQRALILSGAPYEGSYLSRAMAEAGAEVTLTPTLAEALKLMAAERFDVLIADHALPDADVRVASREARRCGIRRTIVLLSPFERRDFGSPHAAGFDAYLIKPVRQRSLFERLAAERGSEPASARPAAARAQNVPLQARRGLRVLLAEDNEVNALLAVRALERLGAVVDWARDGHAALARAEEALAGRSAPFDLILMDVRMPGLDGIEVTRRIRAGERGDGPAMRIVALTASIAGDGVELVGAAGFDGLLLKPFTFEALAAELDAAGREVAVAS